jgi:hypothetical protein
VNRTQLQQLADERLQDAVALLNSARWSGAYYLAGYAVECGLKACIAKMVNQHDFPDRELAQRSYTHDLDVLVSIAGLTLPRKSDVAANPSLGTNWQLVKDWDEKSRYQFWTESQARDLCSAVADAANGVLPWIKRHW